MKKIKKSTLLPLLLLIYLAFMAYQGLPYLYAGRYAYFFGILITTLTIIILLHFTLKHREKQKENIIDKNENKDNSDTSTSNRQK